MENDIVVSVALIVYNHEKYLQQAIESILMQKVNFKYEIIVGDDKSTDNSRKIILEYKEKYPDTFVLLFHEKNVGGTRNIYDTFMKARGKYIACLEGDDYWIDNMKLQKQVDFLDNNTDYLGVSHVIEARDNHGKYLSQHPVSPSIVGKDASIELFLNGIYFSAVTTVFRNIFLDETKDYTIYYKAHKYVGDFTLCLILLDIGKIRILPDVMSVYRSRSEEGESNYNSIRNGIQQYSDHIQLINVLNDYFNSKYDFSKEYLTRSNLIIFNAIRNGKYQSFYNTFKTIPLNYRLKIYLSLPYHLIKTILSKISK